MKKSLFLSSLLILSILFVSCFSFGGSNNKDSSTAGHLLIGMSAENFIKIQMEKGTLGGISEDYARLLIKMGSSVAVVIPYDSENCYFLQVAQDLGGDYILIDINSKEYTLSKLKHGSKVKFFFING